MEGRLDMATVVLASSNSGHLAMFVPRSRALLAPGSDARSHREEAIRRGERTTAFLENAPPTPRSYASSPNSASPPAHTLPPPWVRRSPRRVNSEASPTCHIAPWRHPPAPYQRPYLAPVTSSAGAGTDFCPRPYTRAARLCLRPGEAVLALPCLARSDRIYVRQGAGGHKGDVRRGSRSGS